MFTSQNYTLPNIHLDFVLVNIHQCSLSLWRAIVKYFLFLLYYTITNGRLRALRVAVETLVYGSGLPHSLSLELHVAQVYRSFLVSLTPTSASKF